MILDTSVLIALRSPQDPHADRVSALVMDADDLVVHPVTLAESLVAPARAGIAAEVRAQLTEGLGIRLWHPDDDEPERIALLRADSRVALPDCYPLAVAERTGLPLATFDEALRRTAQTRSVSVR